MKRKWTKWIPFGNYNWDGKDRIVFVRGNRKTGLLQFKTISVHAWRFLNLVNPIVPPSLIDVKKAWDEIIHQINF